MGEEAPRQRAERLARVQLVAYLAEHDTAESDALCAFFAAGYLQAVADMVETSAP
jgi:hypothetical protein